MFGRKKREKYLTAVSNGKIIPLEEVPDEAFASGMLGKGAAVIPSDGTIRSPIDGRIADISPTLHAYQIVGNDGEEILVHIGIDTVKLKGEGFVSLKRAGQKVKAGEVIAEADIPMIAGMGYSTVIPVLFTDSDAMENISAVCGNAAGGKDIMMKYTIVK